MLACGRDLGADPGTDPGADELLWLSAEPQRPSIDVADIAEGYVVNKGSPDEGYLDFCHPDFQPWHVETMDFSVRSISESAFGATGVWEDAGAALPELRTITNFYGEEGLPNVADIVFLPDQFASANVEIKWYCDSASREFPYEEGVRAEFEIWECKENAADVAKYGECTRPITPTDTFALEIGLNYAEE